MQASLNAQLADRQANRIPAAILASLMDGTEFWEKSMLNMLRDAAGYLPEGGAASEAVAGIVSLYEDIRNGRIMTRGDFDTAINAARAAEEAARAGEPYVVRIAIFASYAAEVGLAAYKLAVSKQTSPVPSRRDANVDSAMAECKMKVDTAINWWVRAVRPADDVVAQAYQDETDAISRRNEMAAAANEQPGAMGAYTLTLAGKADSAVRAASVLTDFYKADDDLIRRLNELSLLLAEVESD